MDESRIQFTFPKLFVADKIKGNIQFYKPSDDLLDKNFEINLSEDNKMLFATKEFASGLWKIKVNWEVEGVTYFNEEFLMVP